MTWQDDDQPANVTADVLAWALDECPLSLPEVADRVGVEPVVVRSWIYGEAKPTLGQLRAFAKAVNRMTAIFYLPARPERRPPEVAWSEDGDWSVSSEGIRIRLGDDFYGLSADELGTMLRRAGWRVSLPTPGAKP